MMFTLRQYVGRHVGSPDWNEERKANAKRLVKACAELMEIAEEAGVEFKINPATESLISGTLFGGFRPQSCPIGAPTSAHKEGLAVDLYDPNGKIDAWCVANSAVGDALETCGIYLEHPSHTIGWSHWSIRAPRSKNRIFIP